MLSLETSVAAAICIALAQRCSPLRDLLYEEGGAVEEARGREHWTVVGCADAKNHSNGSRGQKKTVFVISYLCLRQCVCVLYEGVAVEKARERQHWTNMGYYANTNYDLL